MKKGTIQKILTIIAAVMIITGCSPGASYQESVEEPEMERPAAEEPAELPEINVVESVEVEADIYRTSENNTLTIASRANRMIIKNAEVRLQVENSDVAIDRTTQIVSDVGGYIISSRVWYDTWGEESVLYSTITIGVPVDEFERTLRRLRDIAVKVLDENATGEDVTDQFVDLESQLENLEATQSRVRSFLDQATTVEEALEVNSELSKIEAQIEEIQGRMNYLKDRAAYSTITITIEPELKELPTPTPMPTSTPEAWRPSETFGNATRTLKSAYQGLIDLSIWVLFVFIPILAPFIVVGWLIWYFVRKRASKRKKSPDKE